MRWKKKDKSPPFVKLYWEIIDSLAWQGLSNAARVAFVHLLREVRSKNPGELRLTFTQMEKIMNRHTYCRALKKLEEVGFIEKEQYGGLYRRTNIFRLSNRWRQTSSARSGTINSARSGTVHGVENGTIKGDSEVR